MHDLVRTLFPPHEFAGALVRTLTPPDSPCVALVYIQGLIPPPDLERLVLTPLSAGGLTDPPEVLVRSGRFTAPELRNTDNAEALRDGLLSGMAAVHLDGHPGVIMLGNGLRLPLGPVFGLTVADRIAVLVQHLRTPDLCLERHGSGDQGAPVMIYLRSKASPDVLAGIRLWTRERTAPQQQVPWWRPHVGIYRFPPALAVTVPAAAVAALQRGYVLVLFDDLPNAMLAPTTLDLLFTGPGDVALPPPLRRLVSGPRIVAALVGLTLGAFLIAVAGYHHALVPGPFLMAMASSRANMPFPVALEVLLMAVVGDAAAAAVARIGTGRAAFLAWIGMVLAITACLQVGVIGAMSGVVTILAVIAREILPDPALTRAVRVWRYVFMGAAAGLGMYGISLMILLLFVYLSEERAFSHLIRNSPGEAASS